MSAHKAPDPKVVVKKLYDAFARRDGETMASCYSEHAWFTDEVFVNLKGSEVGKMWRMLCSRANDLTVTYEIVEAFGMTVKVEWHAHYTFLKTGRKVHNIIHANIETRGDKVISHRDQFSFWHWSAQALGPAGFLLGWSPLVKSKVQNEARAALNSFKPK